mgnify:CR=1 FL=1
MHDDSFDFSEFGAFGRNAREGNAKASTTELQFSSFAGDFAEQSAFGMEGTEGLVFDVQVISDDNINPEQSAMTPPRCDLCLPWILCNLLMT